MTVGDYIKGKLNIWSVEIADDLISLELSGVGLDPDGNMTAEVNTDAFFYKVIPDILLMPTSISEGGFSLSWDKEALVTYYSMVAKRLGKDNVLAKNTITDITSKWR